jgi:hypothetical protein
MGPPSVLGVVYPHLTELTLHGFVLPTLEELRALLVCTPKLRTLRLYPSDAGLIGREHLLLAQQQGVDELVISGPRIDPAASTRLRWIEVHR